jgi:hypothetical protein
MRCVSRAAAVTAHEQLVSGAETIVDQVRCSVDLRLKIRQ